MISTKLKAKTIILAVVLIFTTLTNTRLTLAWSGLGSFSPYNVYQGVMTQFTFYLQNSGSSSLDVYWVFVSFCWNAWNYGYYFKANDNTAISIPAGGSHDFTASIQVDQTFNGNCPVSVQVNGEAVGEYSAQTLTWSETVNVQVVPAMQLSIVANPSTGTAPLDLTFTNILSGGIPPYTYDWLFGDGSSSIEANPSHTYQAAGTYTVTLIVRDSQGTQKVATASVNVAASPLPLYAGGVIALIAVATAVVLLMQRRGLKQNPPPQPSMPSPT